MVRHMARAHIGAPTVLVTNGRMRRRQTCQLGPNNGFKHAILETHVGQRWLDNVLIDLNDQNRPTIKPIMHVKGVAHYACVRHEHKHNKVSLFRTWPDAMNVCHCFFHNTIYAAGARGYATLANNTVRNATALAATLTQAGGGRP